MNTLDLLKTGSNKLKKNKVLSSLLDSEILLSKVLDKTREEMLSNTENKICLDQLKQYKKFILRRSQKEPVAYILNKKEFWSRDFYVCKDTLIPRPETELLIDILLKVFKNKKISILDIGTGSGCILVTIIKELVETKGIGIDISKKAISIAKINALAHQVSSRAKFIHKSLDSYFSQKFDLVISNPPYIERREIKNLSDDIKKFEPIIALDGGNDGLDLIKKVIYKTKQILKIKGTLALEIGNGQFKEVSKLLLLNNFRIEYKIKDYKNNIRCIISKYLNK
tara:strand:+ start:608 stop:1453 length:846 start_codon:yes stop_codon:yes gene_type:complete